MSDTDTVTWGGIGSSCTSNAIYCTSRSVFALSVDLNRRARSSIKGFSVSSVSTLRRHFCQFYRAIAVMDSALNRVPSVIEEWGGILRDRLAPVV